MITSFQKPYLALPRFKNHPIDSYNFNNIHKSICKNLTDYKLQVIREQIIRFTGQDPMWQSSSREQRLIESRQFFMYFVRKFIKGQNGKPYSLENTGKLLGKDHATVLNAIARADSYIETEKQYRETLNAIAGAICQRFP